MILTETLPQTEQDSALPSGPSSVSNLTCYSLTLFTQRWREIRDFYTNILGARIVGERSDRYSEMQIGGIPICVRQCECGETVSYLHIYLALKNREPVLRELRKRGIIVTSVGPYANFRDPEGRVIKLSEDKTLVA